MADEVCVTARFGAAFSFPGHAPFHRRSITGKCEARCHDFPEKIRLALQP
jgi:hypothetical protein